MENIFDLGKKSYVAASLPQKKSTSEHIRIGLEILYDFLKVLILLIIYSFESFYYVFVPKSKKNIAGQLALITGGGNGIGKQIALRLAREGCKIAIVDIEREAAIQTADEIIRNKGQAKGYHFDIADPIAIEKLRLEVENDFGLVDILVNNAAVIPAGLFMNESFERIKRTVDVNITAVMLMTHVFLKIMMRRRKGHIVNMISLSSYYLMPGGLLYSSTKYALRGFTEGLAQELRINGYENCIWITGIHPYFVATQKELMDTINESLRFPALDPIDVANATVDGMLRNENVISIPSSFLKFAKISTMLPIKVQNAIRDYITRDREFSVFGNK